MKGGDFRAREANVYRLAEVSREHHRPVRGPGRALRPRVRRHCSPTARFGGAQVSRTFYARGQTGQQLLLGAYQALERQIGPGTVKMFPRHEMLDLVVVDGRARGIVTRDMVTGEARVATSADAVVLATGGYGNVFYLSTNAKGCNATAIWRAYKKGAAFANPCYTQIHPTCIPVAGDYQTKLTLMSESLRNDGRIWVPEEEGRHAARRDQIPEDERDYYLERKYPSFGNLAPRDIASRAAKEVCDEGRGVGPGGLGVYLDFADAIKRLGAGEDRARSTATSSRCTSASPARTPTRSRCASIPAIHYTMGGLWVDYNLMSTIPGLLVLGEANFSDHGANRLGASRAHAGPGRRLLRHPLHHRRLPRVARSSTRWTTDHPEFESGRGRGRGAASTSCSRIKGKRTSTSFHRELGKIMWEYCGMARNEAGLETGAPEDPRAARGVLEERATSPAPATSSTSRSRRPAAWPTSSSSAS